MGDVVIPLCERDYTYTGPKKFVCEGQEKWKPEFEQWDCKGKFHEIPHNLYSYS